jgi:hypothetical protein
MSAITLDGPVTGNVRKVKIDGKDYNFSTRVQYESKLSVRDNVTGTTTQLPEPGTAQLTQLYSPAPNVWVTSAVLQKDGTWKRLKKSESKDLLGNKYYPDSQSNDYVLGEEASKGLLTTGPNSLSNITINDGKLLYKKYAKQSDEQVNQEFKISSNVPPSASLPETGDQQGALTENEANYIKSGKDKIASREDYGNTPIVYPEGLKLNYQDCIKFSIVKYKQTGLKGFGEGDRNLRRVVVEGGIPKSADKKRTILGTIVLPIPGGIQDSNRVVWSGSEPLYDPQGAAGKLVQTALQGGDVTKKAEEQFNKVNVPEIRKAIITKTIEGVINSGGLMQREFGAIINPNLELLFNSPDLRQFSFSFKLSPRSKSEAEIVRKIIRTFKQAMSVKRSASSFLLQTPHTFAISYIFKNENHPYLNKFKECALTSCNVNYTPEATYMSFEDGAMVSYQVDLTFQELEPIYDDDYTEIDRDKDDYIGY